MQEDHESKLVLAVALAGSVLLHGLGTVAATRLVGLGTAESPARPADSPSQPKNSPERPKRERKEPVFGEPTPSAVRMNWISHDAYKRLIAKKASIDQAPQQRTAPPDPTAKRSPIDPTAPSPAAPKRRAAAAPASQKRPTGKAAPTRTDRPAGPQSAEKLPEPPMKLSKRVGEKASAPTEGPPKAASVIEKKGRSEKPRKVTDTTSEEKVVDKTPTDLAEADELNVKKQALPEATAETPELAKPAEKPRDERLVRRGPTVDPSSDASPAAASKEVKGFETETPRLAALPTPTPTDKTVAPEDARREKARGRRRKSKAEKAPSTAGEKQGNPTRTARSSAERATTSSERSGARPTAAPKTDREADPVSRVTGEKVRVGKVLAAEGMRIKTVRPDFSVPARYTIPRNPVVQVVFNEQGQAIRAEMVRSTGYANVDGPILKSLYKWEAVPDEEHRIDGRLVVRIRIVLRGEG